MPTYILQSANTRTDVDRNIGIAVLMAALARVLTDRVNIVALSCGVVLIKLGRVTSAPAEELIVVKSTQLASYPVEVLPDVVVDVLMDALAGVHFGVTFNFGFVLRLEALRRAASVEEFSC